MPKKILVVDDAFSIRQALSFVLTSNGFDVTEASDGDEALKKCADERFSLIISDVNMPNMDGITFIKKIKTDEACSENKFTPVIMLTTESGEDKKAEGKEAGVKAWMVKPFPPEMLLDAVKKIIV